MSEPKPTSLPLEYVAEVMFELNLLRDECVNIARALVAQKRLDGIALEECARLDDALALAHRAVQGALKQIQQGRALREDPAK